MRQVKRWEQGDFSAPRPLLFAGWPRACERPSSKLALSTLNIPEPPAGSLTARLDYHNGWTVVVFSNADTYFADEILDFDGMMDLIRSRFPERFYMKAAITRDYVD